MRINNERIAHMHGVAEYMYKNAPKYGLIPEEMYFLGLNHDIGYINNKEQHEEFGAELLSNVGITKPLSDAIKWHGTSPQEYTSINFCSDVDIPRKLVLLWEADMHVDMSGKDVGYDIRLEDIKDRHGMNSEPYRKCCDTVNWLRDWTDILRDK